MAAASPDQGSSDVGSEKMAEPPSETPAPPVEEDHHKTGWALALIIASLMLAAFLVSLDRTIIATAIPYITDEFHAIDDIGWYGSAYMMTNAASQLLFGKIYKFYSNKVVYLLAIGIFEVGSAICGAAPNSTTLIVGRAIAGLGAAGILSGSMMIVLHTIPLHKRPMYVGMFGAVFGLSSVVGPLLGGAFTQRLTWRWCFYINLPIGAVTVAILLLILKVPPATLAGVPLRQQFKQLDPLGNLVFLPSIACLILALQWGGATYPWSDGRVIALFVVFGVLLIAFIAIQIWKGENATIPPRIFRQRSVLAGFCFAFCGASAMMIFVYYLPIWFQAIKGATPVGSGIMTIPMILSLVVASLLSGFFTTKIGYYCPTMITSPILMATGAGLITTFMPDTGHSKWIAYQFLFGFGLGLAMQQPSLAAQASLEKKDVAIGNSFMFFAQQLGGGVFVSVAQSIFQSRLLSGLQGIPGLEAGSILNTGATELRKVVDPQYLPRVLAEYNHAVTRVFVIGVAMTSLMIVPALAMEWRSIKKNKNKSEAPPPEMPKESASA